MIMIIIAKTIARAIITVRGRRRTRPTHDELGTCRTSLVPPQQPEMVVASHTAVSDASYCLAAHTPLNESCA